MINKLEREEEMVYGLFINFFNEFCKAEGLDEILKIILNEDNKLPLDFLTTLVAPFKSIQPIATEEICERIVKAIKKMLTQRVESLEDRDMKDISKNTIKEFMNLMRKILSSLSNNIEAIKIMQNYEMLLSLKFIRSTSLEKRLNGLAEIRRLIDESRSDYENYYESTAKKKITEASNLAKWIIEQKVLESIYDENAHAQIIRRSSHILIFLLKQKLITNDILDLMWNCQKNKHEDIVLAVYYAIGECIDYLETDQLVYILERIKEIPLDKYNDKLLNFMKEFTVKAYERHQDDLKFSTKFPEEAGNNKEEPNEKLLFCTPILWKLLQDNTPVTFELTELANNGFKACLDNLFSINYRVRYLYLCMENLKANRSVPQSLDIALHILKSIKSDKAYFKNLVLKLFECYEVVRDMLESFRVYFEKEIKVLASAGKIEEEKIPIQIFTGKYNHTVNINGRLRFLCTMEEYAPKEYKATNEDLKTLWDMFMEETHPKYNIGLFLERLISEHETQGKIRLIPIFQTEQTLYLFQFLCKARQRLSKDHDFIYFKCLTNNFRIVNVEKRYLDKNKGLLMINDINKLIGLNTLWDCAISCNSEKTRESLNEFLINLYTKVPEMLWERYIDIMSLFITRCMDYITNADPIEDELVILNVLRLLLSFYNSIDGTKYKTKDDTDIKYCSQTVLVIFDAKKVSAKIQLGFDTRIGELRQKIATTFEIPFNGFQMSNKSGVYERDYDDELLKDVGWAKEIHIECFLEEEKNPKLLISNNTNYINQLFLLLSKESASYVESVWELLTTLPCNKKIVDDINSITSSSVTIKDWNAILDTKSIHKFLYVLQIIEEIITPPQDMHLATVEASISYKRWISSFCKKEGLKHLFHAFINLPISSLHHPLTRKCFSMLLKVLNLIEAADYLLEGYVTNFEEYYPALIQRVVVILEAFAQFSILSENEKQLRLLRLQKSPKHDEEETANKEMIAMQKQLREQVEESRAFNYAFKIMRRRQRGISYFKEMSKLPLFKELLLKGLVLSDNQELRKVFADKLLEVCEISEGTIEINNNPFVVLISLMMQMIKETFDKTSNSQEFYRLLSNILKLVSKEILGKVLTNVHDILATISSYIKERPVIERTSKDTDNVLIGLFLLLEQLLNKFPSEQIFVGDSCSMLSEVLKKCLFEFPVMTEQSLSTLPPKCKSDDSRHAAFGLLQALSRNCPENLSKIIGFLTPIHAKGAWRTKREQDWSILAENSEKSAAGYVGLKNLGCICYMNSLLQQLYMIPTFRRDILSIEDAKRNPLLEEDMFYQTQYLFAELYESVKQYYDPKVFCHAFKDWDNKSINVLEQMDVDEFFNVFLDKLESAIKGTKKEKTIKKHFGGIYANQLLCKDCPHSRGLEEPFLAVNLQVKNKKSLEKCLENFVEGEMLQGDNAYNCEKCDKKVTTLKRVCIKRLPRYLIFVLKRFDINYDTMQKFKINDYCEFPKFLNMEPFTVEGLAKKDQEKLREEAHKEDKDIDELPMKDNELPKYPPEYYEYKLSGIIIHIGTADAGHYYSFIKDREKTHLPENKRWFEFNDTIVERYDPEEIKDDAFGGEEKIKRHDGMLFRSIEKSRNAYLLVYDRVSSYEPPEENNEGEDMSSVKEVVEINESPLKIPEKIHFEIMQENIKHWYSLYMFHDHYFEFALKLCMNWDLTENILNSYPCRNNDYTILGLSNEDFLAHAFAERKTKLPLRKPSNNKEVEVQVFKYLATLVLTTFFRLNRRAYIPEFIDLMKAHMNKNKESAKWLLWQFSNQKVIMEFLFECNDGEIRRFVVGLLYCAMLVVFEEEKTRLETPSDGDVLINFTNAILKQLPLCHKHALNVEQYFQVFSRLTFLGPEIRNYFHKTKLLNRLISFLSNNKDINCDDIVFKENVDPEIGLPSEVDERFQSPLEKFLSASRERKDQGITINAIFLIEAISFLLRSVIYEDGLPSSPFALPDCKRVLDSDTKKILKENILEIISNSAYPISISAITGAFKHLGWEYTSFKSLLLNSIVSAIKTNDNNKVIVSVHLFEELISLGDSEQTTFVPIALSEFNKMLKNTQWASSVIMYLIKHMIQFARFIPLANEWYCNNTEQWKWIFDLVKPSNLPYLLLETAMEASKQRYNVMTQYDEFLRQKGQIEANLTLLKEGNNKIDCRGN